MGIATTVKADDIVGRLAAVRQNINAAASRAGRASHDVTLIAVSKTVSPDRIREAIRAGVTDLGENRVQEAESKIPELGREVQWHLIGHLQTNKIAKAIDLFDFIHGVDTLDLAKAIGLRAQRAGKAARVLLQVNLAFKETQFGFSEPDLPAMAESIARLDGLMLDGLMCIAPETEIPEQTRPYFQRLASHFHQLTSAMRHAGHPWRHLSMGMTNDYPIAVEEGATLVRVGRAIFGKRATVPANNPLFDGSASSAQTGQVRSR